MLALLCSLLSPSTVLATCANFHVSQAAVEIIWNLLESVEFETAIGQVGQPLVQPPPSPCSYLYSFQIELIHIVLFTLQLSDETCIRSIQLLLNGLIVCNDSANSAYRDLRNDVLIIASLMADHHLMREIFTVPQFHLVLGFFCEFVDVSDVRTIAAIALTQFSDMNIISVSRVKGCSMTYCAIPLLQISAVLIPISSVSNSPRLSTLLAWSAL